MPDRSGTERARGYLGYFSGRNEQRVKSHRSQSKSHDENTPKKHSRHTDHGLIPYLGGSHEVYRHDYVSQLPIHGKAKSGKHSGQYRDVPESRRRAAPPTRNEPQSIQAQVDPCEQYHYNEMPQPSPDLGYAPFSPETSYRHGSVASSRPTYAPQEGPPSMCQEPLDDQQQGYMYPPNSRMMGDMEEPNPTYMPLFPRVMPTYVPMPPPSGGDDRMMSSYPREHGRSSRADDIPSDDEYSTSGMC